MNMNDDVSHDAISLELCSSTTPHNGGGTSSHLCESQKSENGEDSSRNVDESVSRLPLETFLLQRQRVSDKMLQARKRVEDHWEASVLETFNKALRQHGLLPPNPCPAAEHVNGQERHLLDREKQRVYSEFIRRSRMQLPEFVRPLRGETNFDSRPNKALEISSWNPSWNSYDHKSKWSNIVHHGVKPKSKSPFPKQSSPPKNHGSTLRALNSIIKSLRTGQDTKRYVILDIDLLSILEDFTCSPFGASVNDNTAEKGEITISYDAAVAIANRVLDVASKHPDQQHMMTGDVNGAFRHIPIAAEVVGRFAGTIPELGILVIDLYCPFGWENSPSSYWVAGAAINHLYACAAPMWPDQPTCAKGSFDAKAWCDDHIAIEADERRRATRKKFSSWFKEGKALGLNWNLKTLTVSMPPEKIRKALTRVQELIGCERTTRTKLNKLVGSLRHVVTCIRPVASFFQRIAEQARLSPRFGSTSISQDVTEDLRWFELILQRGRLNSIPLVQFASRSAPNYHVQMDASGRGLCALFPAHKQFFQLEFDHAQRELIREFNQSGNNEFGINVRELMSVVYAALIWGSLWTSGDEDPESHVKFWIDNMSAVA
ncbi:hypothetical protein F443_10427 [Phytophthora nicotianae P1569]|uniref:Reverse transcriptase domain-containing protein n=1 Tax=Phytophthora nicotianae P1569 TaxID=1317065 RepID=V9F3J9_PHYNI|nr:hypothetical protein F443_10427 [Phytophthora nicotianae P1569]